MGSSNTLTADITCPRCGSDCDMEVEVRFGLLNQFNYKIGDKYRWIDGRSGKRGRRPADGNYEGEGYAECPACKLDFFVSVTIEADIISRLQPNLDHLPYLHDQTVQSVLTCPACQNRAEMDVNLFDIYGEGQVTCPYCDHEFFVYIERHSKRIDKIEVDLRHLPYPAR